MKYKFDLIRNIDINDENSWKGKIFLTFDVDWANDEVWKYSIELLKNYDIPATWFITHKSDLSAEIISNAKFDFGIHPNFNQFFEEESTNEKIEDVLKNFDQFLPKSNILRSHSLLQSEKLLDVFSANGFNFICNSFIPLKKDNKIYPWELWNSIKILPHCWQDNVSMKMELNFPNNPNFEDLIILNFHPIHVFLNTDTISLYEKTRIHHNDFNRLKQYVNTSLGIRSKLISLIENTH